MKKTTVLLGLLMLSTFALAQSNEVRTDRVLTKAEQQALTPAQVIALLTNGNDRFVSGKKTIRDHSSLVREAVSGQHPKQKNTLLPALPVGRSAFVPRAGDAGLGRRLHPAGQPHGHLVF